MVKNIQSIEAKGNTVTVLGKDGSVLVSFDATSYIKPNDTPQKLEDRVNNFLLTKFDPTEGFTVLVHITSLFPLEYEVKKLVNAGKIKLPIDWSVL